VKFQTVARGLACALLERIESGQLTLVENGNRRVFGSGSPQATVVVRDPRVWTALRKGGKGLAESYVDGWWDSPDVTAVIEVAARNLHGIDELRRRLTPVREPWQRGRAFLQRNTPLRSRDDIAAHYDLGNDLFELMLDDTMMYSAAIFDRRDQPLEAASRAKLDRICDKLDLQPSDHVLEIGTGWGGFALYAAGELGCRVTTITISREQHALATERVRDAGLDDLVTVELRDYRDVSGEYDAIVSIEMLEAVGAEYHAAYFAACDRALKPGGRFSLQVITFPDAAYEAQRRGANWIQTYIFPGGLCPSLAVIERSLHGTRLLIREVHDIAPSYVRTLRAWRDRFLGELEAVRAQGFDDRFIRMWEYYLALSEAGFATGLSQDLQIVLEKGRGVEA